jgi:hypothetical protein
MPLIKICGNEDSYLSGTSGDFREEHTGTCQQEIGVYFLLNTERNETEKNENKDGNVLVDIAIRNLLLP